MTTNHNNASGDGPELTAAAAGLRRWAAGAYACEAAAELLTRAFGGRFARPGNPWIAGDPGGWLWLDAEQITDTSTGALSSGERRLLAVVAALAGDRAAELGDIACGLDRPNLDLVLAAIAHAGGSHEHSDMIRTGDGTCQLVRLPSLHHWPSTTTR
jgi:hypothetical protein